MVTDRKCWEAIAHCLRPIPTDDDFESKLIELYRALLCFSDLPMNASQGDRIQEAIARFRVYWTYEAIEAATYHEAADWRIYLAQCLDSPAFLDYNNVEVMVDQICSGMNEGKLTPETLAGLVPSPEGAIAVSGISADCDTEESLQPSPVTGLPHLGLIRIYPIKSIGSVDM